MPFKPTYEVPTNRHAYTILGQQQAEESENGRVGLLMLHGFMGSPISSLDMAQFFAERGITVHCPLLPGHGNLPEKLHGFTLRHWIAEAEEALSKMRDLADTIFIMGHSMGAVLAAYLVERNSDLRGIIMLAPLYDVPDSRIKWSRYGRFFMNWFYPLKRKSIDRNLFLGRVTDFNPEIDVTDPSLAEWLVHATRIPVGSVWEMTKAAAIGQKLWPRINLPALILQGEDDPAVSSGNAQTIYHLLPNADKELCLLADTGHELMRPFEPVHEQVWRKIAAFIADRAPMQLPSF